MKRFLTVLVSLAALGALAAWFLSAPKPLYAAGDPSLDAGGDAERGKLVFYAGGCPSCHMTPGQEDRLKLGGGLELGSPFGAFYAPNISPHPRDGIGNWKAADLANAMLAGVSPRGEHYYPAFPYTSYARMTVTDVMDLKAWLDTLPAEPSIVPDHELAFPYNFRRGLGLWKLLNLDPAPVVDVGADPELERGRYLTEGPGHCGECHTPRDVTGGLELKHWLAGAPAPDGKGRIPNITSGPDGLADWSTGDIAYALESGFKPDYDTLGSTMAEVQANLAKLPASDREAIAAYLKATPPLLEGS
ncbi:MAG: cytochrome c [Geminicoccaceae bacterium]|nr:cytochrome c [Geminicoccaceae bacterium]